MNRFFLLILFFVFVGMNGYSEPIDILVLQNQSRVEKTAAKELLKYLSLLYPGDDFTITKEMPSGNRKIILIGNAENLAEYENLLPAELPDEAESFSIFTRQFNNREVGVIAGSDNAGTMYAVYTLLEKLGCGFYLTYETIPEGNKQFSFAGWNIADSPVYPVRMVFNWHNFLSGISTWNLEEWNQWIEQSAKMRYNTIVVHAYGNNPMLPFEFNGQEKEVGYLANTKKGQDWGTNHTNDVRRLYGAKAFFTDRIFGAEASKVHDSMRVDAAVDLAQQAFDKADQFGMNVAFTFDIATGTSVPENIVNTLPEHAKVKTRGTFYPNPETDEGYAYFKAQAKQIFDLYPQVDFFVPWVRYMWPDTAADWMRVEQFPAVWEKEFTSDISEGNLEDNSFTRSLFFIGKICKAYRKALDELGHEKVKLGIGTWNWHSFTTMDVFLPGYVEFFPLDWNMDFQTDFAVNTLTSIDPGRKVYPIVWAHHDDHRYIGKPYTPYNDFADMLGERNSAGFGIIHWTTRPLDIYFKSLSKQVWENSLNESLEETVAQFAKKTFESDAPVFRKYMYEWITKAAMFGRETSEYFYDMKDTEQRLKRFQLGDYGNPLDYPENAVEEAQKRLLILDEIDTLDLSEQAKDWYRYFYGFEKFLISFNRNQKYLIDAFDLIEREEYSKAKEILSKTDPEQTIRLFSEFSSQGYITQGEKGLIVSLNLRWLPDFYVFMQKLKMMPVRYNFAPTFHEYLAGSSRGKYTFYFSEDKTVWRSMGEEETGQDVKIMGDISPKNEIAAAGIRSENSFELEAGIWRSLRRLEEWQDDSLLPGKYEVELIVSDPKITKANNSIYELQLVDRDGKQVAVGKVNVFNESKHENKPVHLRFPFSVKQGQKLNFRFVPVQGKIVVNGLVIHPVD